MKFIKTIVFSIVIFGFLNNTKAQTLNLNSLNDSKHIIQASIGWDYSLSYSLGYAYKLNSKLPIILQANFSIPSGENPIDDFKTKIGGQIVLLNKSNLKGSITLNGIYRRYQNPLVTLQNFGSEVKGIFGYFKPKWFIAGQIGFDKAVVSHFKHSLIYKETIYQDVEDGWYLPSTGGNFYYGLQTGYSFRKSDLTFNIEMVTTQDFKTTPLIPYYMMVGYNYKIKWFSKRKRDTDKIILFITAFMVGMSNGLNEGDTMLNGNQNHTEQQHKKD